MLKIPWACFVFAGAQVGDALQLHTPTNRKGKSETDWVSSVLLDDLLRQYREATDAAEAKVGRDFDTFDFSIWPIWSDLCEASGRRHQPVFIALDCGSLSPVLLLPHCSEAALDFHAQCEEALFFLFPWPTGVGAACPALQHPGEELPAPPHPGYPGKTASQSISQGLP